MGTRRADLDHARAVASVAEERPGCIDPLIYKSWKRCLDRGEIDPFHRQGPVVLTATELRSRRQPLEQLIHLAGPEIENLNQAFARTGYAVILTDAKGIILHHLSDDCLRDEFRASGLWLGADWGEDRAGTNGIGTCLTEGAPVTVHRGDHLLGQNIHLTCSASPIHDPQGRIIAALDASCCSTDDSRAAQSHARALVATSARIIENQYFLRQFHDQRVLRFHHRPELIALPNEALIAVGQDGRILAANNATVGLLGEETQSSLVGRELEELIGGGLEKMLAGDHSAGTVHSFRDRTHGMRFFGFLHGYQEERIRPRGVTVAPAQEASDACRGQLCDLDTLAGRDVRMQQSVRRARRVMNKRIPIILNGETGTGKELFSRAVHLASERREQNFVALNCAAIPESLIESELFGYKHGAFTGARKEGHRGKIIESSGGTLFLDEIGDMPTAMQSRLLRVLETHEVVQLGAERTVEVNLNIIAATHRDLLKLVADGLFREDLYYRLNGITLYLSPLRDRCDLRDMVLKILAVENDTGIELEVAQDAMSALLTYGWPGNVRQLRNVIRTAVALCEDGVILRDDLNLPPSGQHSDPTSDTLDECVPPSPGNRNPGETDPLRSAEHQVIQASLESHDWNVSRTAEALGMSRNTLYRKLRRHGLVRSQMD